MLDPAKDIEAVHPANAGLLAQGRAAVHPVHPGLLLLPAGLLRALYRRRPAVVLRRAERTADVGQLADFTSIADILIVAAGSPGVVTGDMVREGVIAVDVGINPVRDRQTGKTRLVGDLDYAGVAAKAEAITPVPGGVGPVTDVWLVRNAVAGAVAQQTTLPMDTWVSR